MLIAEVMEQAKLFNFQLTTAEIKKFKKFNLIPEVGRKGFGTGGSFMVYSDFTFAEIYACKALQKEFGLSLEQVSTIRNKALKHAQGENIKILNKEISLIDKYLTSRLEVLLYVEGL